MPVSSILFILFITAVMAIFMAWGFKNLPQERWQIFAALPLTKNKGTTWKGLNLTYYGILSANAYVFSLSIMMILLGACHIPVSIQIKYIVPILIAAIPAARILAWIVERKTSTFTVGGAVFTAIIILPWVVMGINVLSDFQMPVFCFFAASAIAYAFGEGLGRLACVSFGCCYGKPLSESDKIMNRLFGRMHFIFYGKTKKIAYASNLEGEAVIPIQAVTSIIYTITAIAGTVLFLYGYFKAAMLVSLIITQVWRVFSEFFRADYRGDSRFSAYQLMALTAVVYMGIIAMIVPSDMSSVTTSTGGALYLPAVMLNGRVLAPDIVHGLRLLWQPLVILSLEFFWLITFLYTGRSFVTGSDISFHVVKDKI